ncbi:hypothetical protein K488DRAFT_84529 [Vararia minispora EC-137]|uniref:Uncharacterized protein n=1 Tax=Vararia minispora EC-137 TaxID=1314806 RepID=A0ACB8QPW4_9AGAM|nr:hypothetical protein K488DRAFT_84529 [Vararia minispora EC-137]
MPADRGTMEPGHGITRAPSAPTPRLSQICRCKRTNAHHPPSTASRRAAAHRSSLPASSIVSRVTHRLACEMSIHVLSPQARRCVVIAGGKPRQVLVLETRHAARRLRVPRPRPRSAASCATEPAPFLALTELPLPIDTIPHAIPVHATALSRRSRLATVVCAENRRRHTVVRHTHTVGAPPGAVQGLSSGAHERNPRLRPRSTYRPPYNVSYLPAYAARPAKTPPAVAISLVRILTVLTHARTHAEAPHSPPPIGLPSRFRIESPAPASVGPGTRIRAARLVAIAPADPVYGVRPPSVSQSDARAHATCPFAAAR